MKIATLRLLALIVGVLLIGSGGSGSVQGQGAFAHGAVVALQDTPHLWFADEHGVLHWGGDTRALAGKHVNWNDRRDVSLAELQTYLIGDPWLSAGLLKDGDPIYQVKWESEWPQPKLLHIQSIKDVELFGINGSNYGNFVIDKAAWEQRYGIDAATLERQPLASAVPPGVTLTLAPVPAAAGQPTPVPAATPVVTVVPTETSDWIYMSGEDELTGVPTDSLTLFAEDYGMALMIRCKVTQFLEGLVGVTEGEKPLPGGPEKRLKAYYRFDDGPIKEEWWRSAVQETAAFIPGRPGETELVRFLEGLIGSTRLVIRIVNHKGLEYTGVFNVTGAPSQLRKLYDRCNIYE